MLGMQTLASLQGVRSAFLMGPKERAVYLRRPVPRGRQVVEQSGEEEAATVAGTNAAALRAWLRQVGHAHQPMALIAIWYMLYHELMRSLKPEHAAAHRSILQTGLLSTQLCHLPCVLCRIHTAVRYTHFVTLLLVIGVQTQLT